MIKYVLTLCGRLRHLVSLSVYFFNDLIKDKDEDEPLQHVIALGHLDQVGAHDQHRQDEKVKVK
jgi:hypothetical protein